MYVICLAVVCQEVLLGVFLGRVLLMILSLMC
jgi:hypothetical protein